MTEAKSSLGHFPGERWLFDEGVADVFDDMLRRSIPEYRTMRDLVFEVGRPLVQSSTHVVDLGCSRGEALAPFVTEFGAGVRYLGVEVSEPMRSAARDRFKSEIDEGWLEIRDLDLRSAYPEVSASLTLAVLTLQFTPMEHRFRIVQDVYDHTVDGGAFILIEKVLGSSARLDRLLVTLYHEFKRRSGYSREEIDRKRLSLEGVLVPVTAAWNEDILRRVGFSELDCFWRTLNFAGWLALKREAPAP